MNVRPLFFLFLVGACGTDMGPGTSSNGGSVGQMRSINAFVGVSDREKARVSEICSALAQKEAILDSAISTAFTFDATQTDCSRNTISGGPVSVTIQRSNNDYVFKKQDGQDFIFPVVETTSSGVFKALCSNLNTLSNPVIQNSEATYFDFDGISVTDCTPASGDICIKIEKALVSGFNATVHTNEWLRIRTDSSKGRTGFFTQRKKVSKSFCGDREFLSFSATLK